MPPYISKIKITLQNICCVADLEMTYEYSVSEIKTNQINLIDCRMGKEIKCQFCANRDSVPKERLHCSHWFLVLWVASQFAVP